MTQPLDLSGGENLTGQVLIAMPQMTDPRFERTVIYICAHNEDGAMGLVVNKVLENLTFADMLEQLKIDRGAPTDHIRVHFGGPVESGRGFVLHTNDYEHEGAMPVHDNVVLTATIDVLRAIGRGEGPRRQLMALGYAGWGPGQLESEIQANGWLHGPADESLLFDDDDNSAKWKRAVAMLGFDISLLSVDAGHA